MIAIYSNSKAWGGVEILITRFANYLREKNIKFCVIEPEGTRLANDLSWATLVSPSKVNEISDQVMQLFFPNVSKLRDVELRLEVFSNANIFAWIVHPNEAFSIFFPFTGKTLPYCGYKCVSWHQMLMPKHNKLVRKLFLSLLAKKALAVMDGATSRTLKYFYSDMSIHPILIPIPTVVEQSIGEVSKHHNGLSVGYLGRLDSMKYSALAPLVRQLGVVAKNQSVELHVIAEGENIGALRTLCQKMKVSFHEYGFQPNETAKRIIMTKTDFAVAMGTAALDIASIGHPCVIIDPVLGLVAKEQVKFRFVHEIDEFTVGEYRDFPFYKGGKHTIDEVINLVQQSDVGEAGRNYVLNNHCIETSFDLLLHSLAASKIQAREAAPLVNAVWESYSKLKSYKFSFF